MTTLFITKNFYRFIAVCMVTFPFLLSIGCKNVGDPREELIPLSVGNYWAYVRYVYMGDQLIEGLTDSFKVEVTDEIMLRYNGESYKVAVWTWFTSVDGDPLDHSWFQWNGPDGLYLLGGMSTRDTLIEKILELKYPVREGDSWEFRRLTHDVRTGKFFIEETLRYTCVATDEEFETPIGTFTCYVYHTRRKPSEDVLEYWDYYRYYAPGIGPVGQIVKSSRGGDTKSKRVIISYLVN